MTAAGKDTFIVVGTGVFGSSTALELAQTGRQVITLDRSIDGYCASDSASNDINKIIRADYSDEHYRELAKLAISEWKRSDTLKQYFHETGLFFHTGVKADAKVAEQYINGAIKGARIQSSQELASPGEALKRYAYKIESKSQLQECFPKSLEGKLGSLQKDIADDKNKAYFNPRGGWAEAAKATFAILNEAKRLGVRIEGNANVKEIIFDTSSAEKRAIGVQCSDGRVFHTTGNGFVIICIGGWAENFLRNSLGKRFIPTWSSAQCIVTLQLNKDQCQRYKDAPVVLEFASGFYLFEPDENGLMKIAIHGKGFRHPLPSESFDSSIAFPTFQDSKNEIDSVPQDYAKTLLKHLDYVYPELSNAPIVYTRICYYSQSLDENWLIDYIPDTSNLVIASCDSGHAFKFLPILGNLVCKRIGLKESGSLTLHQSRIFSFSHHQQLYQNRAKFTRETNSFQAKL